MFKNPTKNNLNTLRFDFDKPEIFLDNILYYTNR